MRLASLFSGGKDSTFATYLMEQQGHVVEELVGILPADKYSWIFHTPNLHLLPLMAEAMGKRLVTTASSGTEEGDLEALRKALEALDVDGVITGAIASDYQWDRINGVCEDLGLKTFSPLWRKGQRMLMEDLVDAGIRSIIVGVFAEGLDLSWLGREMDHRALEDLKILGDRHGINLSGEGGEYESLVLSSPLHQAVIKIDEFEIEWERDVGRLTVQSASLVRT